MQGLKLQDHGEFGGAPDLVLNNMAGDFRRKRERKSHRYFLVLSDYDDRFFCGLGLIIIRTMGIRMRGRGISFEETADSGHQKIERRNAFRRVNAPATRYQ
jgi:hypothetical protein